MSFANDCPTVHSQGGLLSKSDKYYRDVDGENRGNEDNYADDVDVENHYNALWGSCNGNLDIGLFHF